MFISYFDGLDASTGVMAADFDHFRDAGIGGVRVFANWWDVQGTVKDSNPLIQSDGTLNPATLATLKTLLDVARARGLVVDLSFACETVAGLGHAQYQAGLAATAAALNDGAYRHVIFDLANERSEGDVGCPSGGFSLGQVQALRTAVKNVDPSRLVTASDVGTTGNIVTNSDAADLDFVAYHDPRGPNGLNGFKPQLDAVLWDGDGMLDSWTNYFSAAGPTGNPDGDAANNLTEFQNGTHPRGNAAWTMYFAEGAENSFWDAIYAMANPGGTAARTIAIFSNEDGGIASTISTVPG